LIGGARKGDVSPRNALCTSMMVSIYVMVLQQFTTANPPGLKVRCISRAASSPADDKRMPRP
jgi:hypothetical protein